MVRQPSAKVGETQTGDDVSAGAQHVSDVGELSEARRLMLERRRAHAFIEQGRSHNRDAGGDPE